MIKRLYAVHLLILSLMMPGWAVETVTIASSETLAATQLASYLGKLHPQTLFVTGAAIPGDATAIVVGSDATVRSLVPGADLSIPESYHVTTVRRNGRELGVIAGADPRGTLAGVHALLQNLGFGFDLTGDELPAPSAEPFGFTAWSLANAPLVGERIVFNWHNFLSGCSTWNPDDWQRWTEQSQKMGFNALMVHAYGNNPMAGFTFNGKAKPTGYLTTTARGRDWATMHVNDVRRLHGGQVFTKPVFGADAAMVPDDRRETAAVELMHQVFAHARQRFMDVYLAVDVDTGPANPQDLILSLPESARFAVRAKAGIISGVPGEGEIQFWLADPDTPEGYDYYKAQVAAWLKAYTHVTCLVLWFRERVTPWMELKIEEMPASWQQEYQTAIQANPRAAELWRSHNLFAIGKIARAWQRAIDELAPGRVRLAAGSWNFAFLPAADVFFPPATALIGLDFDILHGKSQFATAEKRAQLAAIGQHRSIIPVIWAHHDDGAYIGRPYTPFAGFHDKLADSRAAGFGIIHWTTRPLDLFFHSHIRQVWRNSENEPLHVTCKRLADTWFGPSARDIMGEYLERWITEAPMFARETGDYFIDRPLTDIPAVVAGCQDRLQLLRRIDRTPLTPRQCERLRYHEKLEEFTADFFTSHGKYQLAREALERGDTAAASAAIMECEPEALIRRFAALSSIGGITRGEQGLVISLNTRWLPHIIRLRQQLGLEAIRYKLGPTSHDPLAQAPGRFTFHFDEDRRLWQTLGSQETGAATFHTDASPDDLHATGIESDTPITLEMAPILSNAHDAPPLPAGNYRLRMHFLDPQSTAPGQRIFTVAVETRAALNSQPDSAPSWQPMTLRLVGSHPVEIDIFAETGGSKRSLERVFDLKLKAPSRLRLTLTPLQGKVTLCGVVLEQAAKPGDP